MSAPRAKRCLVAYASSRQQYLWTVDLPTDGTINDALGEARRIANLETVPWDSAPVGIFGELRARTDLPQDGDRIEIYHPLKNDPRQRRRDHVQRQRRNPKS